MAGILTKGVAFKMGAVATSPTYTEVPNLQEFPDLLGSFESVDVTTLADNWKHYIPGIRDVGGSLAFAFLYDNTATGNFRTIKAAEGTEKAIEIAFPDGTKFHFNGYVGAQINGKGVNEALTFTCMVFMTSDITIVNPT